MYRRLEATDAAALGLGEARSALPAPLLDEARGFSYSTGRDAIG